MPSAVYIDKRGRKFVGTAAVKAMLTTGHEDGNGHTGYKIRIGQDDRYEFSAARQVMKSKMGRHDIQMQALVSRVVLLDDDGVARVAGEIFDEPALARPLAGDELNGLIPERFFVLQDELRARARRLVVASGKHDHEALADEFAGLAKGCVTCHQTFVGGPVGPVGAPGDRP